MVGGPRGQPGWGDGPLAWCDVRHACHWVDGGSTSLDNLVMLCPTDHATLHHTAWEIHIAEDHLPELIPQDRLDPQQTPRRNPLHSRE